MVLARARDLLDVHVCTCVRAYVCACVCVCVHVDMSLIPCLYSTVVQILSHPLIGSYRQVRHKNLVQLVGLVLHGPQVHSIVMELMGKVCIV